MRRRLLACCLGLAAALVLAGPAAALTRQQADSIALATLSPASLSGDVVLFGLPKPLRAGAAVTEAGPGGQVLKKPGKAAWLYWEDVDPGALYAHASVALLVDDATGRVLARRTLGYYPLIDGKPPTYLRSSRAYDAPGSHVYATPAAPARSGATERAAPARAGAERAGAFADDCLLMVVLSPTKTWEDENAKAALQGWQGLAAQAGFPAFVATATGPASVTGIRGLKPPPFAGQVDDASLGRNVDELVGSEHCQDVMLYVLGHGQPPPNWFFPEKNVHVAGGPPSITLGLKPPPPGRTGKTEAKRLTPGGLERIVEKHAADATFKLVLEACFAQRFQDELFDEENVRVEVYSSGREETTKGYLEAAKVPKDDLGNPVTSAVPNPGRPEFSHGLIEGIRATLSDAQTMADLTAQGDSLLARVIKEGFAREAENDRAARAGLTTPASDDHLVDARLFEVEAAGSYQHFQGYSEVYVSVRTVPEKPGAEVRWRVLQGATGVIAGGSGTGFLDADGKRTVTVTIGSKITYVIEVTVVADGIESTTTVEVPVQ